MKTRFSLVREYSHGKTFDEAVTKLFKGGLMNGSFEMVQGINLEHARWRYPSWYSETYHEAAVIYIVTEKYNEKYDEWTVDFSEGIEVIPCQ